MARMSGRREETALGVARARFVEGLPRRTRELKGAIALLTASPGDARAREELRRRLHALFASAQVFRIERLAEGLKGCIAVLDAAREGHRSLTDVELEELARVSLSLPELAVQEPKAGASVPAPPLVETIRAPEPSPEIDVVTSLPEEAIGGYRVPAVDDLGSTKPPAKERKSVEEAALRLAIIDPSAAKSAPQTDDPFDAAVTTPGTLGAANGPRTTSGAPSSSRAARPAGPVVPPAPAIKNAGASRLPAPKPPVVSPLPPARVAGPQSAPSQGPKRPSAPPAPKPASAAAVGLPTVVSVLVVDDAQSLAHVKGALPAERFEVLSATDPEEALRLARTAAPDVVLVSKAVVELRDLDFVTRLRSDPLNGDVPLVLLYPPGKAIDANDVSASGADDAIASPVDAGLLAARIAELCGLDGQGAGIGRLGDMTVSAVADRIAEEIRRGLAGAVEEGADLAVPLGVGSEVLAAAWAAIARVRAHVYEASHGRVRFRDLPRRGAPTVVGIVDGLDREGDGPEIALVGRRLLIADDDPAVLWFFSQVLKEAGAEVTEAHDGVEALELARRVRPEVVLSDILMPRMDGMALCRELARDPALGATPVILLSWKEDFIQRMRELRAGAHGYLRKEEGTTQILRRVREALRPRANLERMLRAGGEVRGRVEQIGVVPVLRAVARERPDARLTVRDAYSLFEVDFREGALVDVTRTAADGGFARGARALPLLVGVADGRFTVVDSDGSVRPTIEAPLDAVLDDVCARLGAVIDAVSGAGLGRAAQLEIDPDVLDSIVATSPGRAGELAEKLRAGMSPPALLVSGGVEPQLLESVLVDLARRGGVRRVTGPNGEDRVTEALTERLRGPEPRAKAETPSGQPPPETEWLREAVRTSVVPTPEPAPRKSEADDLLADIVSSSQELDAVVPTDEEKRAAAADAVPKAPVGALPAPLPEATAPIPSPPRATPAPALKPAPRSRAAQVVGWGATLGVLALLGFYGARTAEEAIEDEPIAGAVPDPTAVHAATNAGDSPEAPEPDAPAHVADGEPKLYGRSVPTIVSDRTAVAAGQGLLRIEADAPMQDVEVLVGDRGVGAPPLDIALDEGLHELAFRSGDQLRYRYVFIRAGQSRIVPAP